MERAGIPGRNIKDKLPEGPLPTPRAGDSLGMQGWKDRESFEASGYSPMLAAAVRFGKRGRKGGGFFTVPELEPGAMVPPPDVPTPTASDATLGSPRYASPLNKRMGAMNGGAMWPTPGAGEAEFGGRDLDKRLADGRQLDLIDAARLAEPAGRRNRKMFPTPSALVKNESIGTWEARRRRKAKEGVNLQRDLRIEAAKLDGEDPRAPSSERPYLCPEWVEWLMGWPIGWTDPDGGPGTDGVEAWAAATTDGTWWAAEPEGVPRLVVPRDKPEADKVAARLKMLGNGQVPACAAAAWRLATCEDAMGDDTTTDTRTAATRSMIMRAIRRERTGPEERMAEALRARGLEWDARNDRTLPGSPDFAFRDAKVALFVDGCFWHGCDEHYKEPRTNKGYWGPKIARNKARDKKTKKMLEAMGWVHLRVWEHDVLKGGALGAEAEAALAATLPSRPPRRRRAK